MAEEDERTAPHESLGEGEIVRVTYTADVDRDRLEEYAEEHHPDADYVQIDDRVKGDGLLFHGERPGYICPECGRESHGIRHSGGTRVYSHGIDDNCEWQDPEWEPSEYHPDHPSNQKPRWLRWATTALSWTLPIVVIWGVLQLFPQTTMTINGETAPFPPNGIENLVIVLVAFAFIAYVAMKYAPGIAGGRGSVR